MTIPARSPETLTVPTSTSTKTATVVLHVGRQFRGSEKLVVEKALRERPGVMEVEANPVAQTATVAYDPAVTSVAELRRSIRANTET